MTWPGESARSPAGVSPVSPERILPSCPCRLQEPLPCIVIRVRVPRQRRPLSRGSSMSGRDRGSGSGSPNGEAWVCPRGRERRDGRRRRNLVPVTRVELAGWVGVEWALTLMATAVLGALGAGLLPLPSAPAYRGVGLILTLGTCAVSTSLTDRPSRSSFHTTRPSPAWGRRWSSAAVRPGRWLLRVEMVSSKIRAQPAWTRASRCNWVSWLSVETLVRPIRCGSMTGASTAAITPGVVSQPFSKLAVLGSGFEMGCGT
jgi:hypothetical protein